MKEQVIKKKKVLLKNTKESVQRQSQNLPRHKTRKRKMKNVKER